MFLRVKHTIEKHFRMASLGGLLAKDNLLCVSFKGSGLKLIFNCHLRDKLRIFLFRRICFILLYVPFSRYSSVCIINHPMIYQICNVMMSIGT